VTGKEKEGNASFKIAVSKQHMRNIRSLCVPNVKLR
jgi:hypothetical protein